MKEKYPKNQLTKTVRLWYKEYTPYNAENDRFTCEGSRTLLRSSKEWGRTHGIMS